MPQRVAIVSVAFPAQGHLNQLLHFSLLLSSSGGGVVDGAGFDVHFACSAIHNRQAKLRLHGWDSDALDTIAFHDLDFPSFPTPPPDPESETNFPTHLDPLFAATVLLEAPLSVLLRSISATHRRVVVFHDSCLPFAAQLAAALPNAEALCFSCVPSYASFPFMYAPPGSMDPPEGTPSFMVPEAELTVSDEFKEFFAREVATRMVSGESVVFNTSRAIEGEMIDLLLKEPSFRDDDGRKVFAVGPIHPAIPICDVKRRHECLDWLDRQPARSVVYVSFGSTTTLSAAEIEQLAMGLRQSGRRFIWVLRDADSGDIFTVGENPRWVLPVGFEEAVEGVVVRGWAPQLEILCHPSTAAFVSHCGWNSSVEAMSFGVPIMAWPMHSDQPINARMVVEYLRTGVMVREWARRREVVPASEIAGLIRKVVDGEDGGMKEMRERAGKLGEAIRSSVREGGSSRQDLMALIAHITRP